MNNEYEEQVQQLQKVAKQVKTMLKHAPEGALRISHNKKSAQYYHVTDQTGRWGKYIRKENMQLIKDLAQKDYAQKILRVLGEIRLKNEYDTKEVIQKIIAIYEKYPNLRQELIEPYILNGNQYAVQWLDIQNEKIKSNRQGSGWREPQTDIYTEQGEQVRSKSEKILADKLYMMGIPYAYEVPLYLSGYGTVHPDFLVLNRHTRKEYIWEHLGLMDESEYSNKAIRKIELFEKNGIWPGRS